MIVDFEHHYLPETLWRKYGGKPGEEVICFERGRRKLGLRDLDYQVEKHLEAMDAAGIDAAVFTSWEPSLADCSVLNDDLAELQEKYHKRIIGFAHVPPLGGVKSLRELERSIRGLGLKGVAITAHIRNKSLDHETLFPFYSKVCELNVPIFVHASAIPPFPVLAAPYDLFSNIGREMGLALATCRIIFGGVLEEFPELKFIIGHLGGGIGAIKERFALQHPHRSTVGSRMKKEWGYYFDKLFFNTAGFLHGTKAILASLQGMRPSQIILGTDFPHGGMTADRLVEYMKALRSLPVPPESLYAILEGNATHLLKL